MKVLNLEKLSNYEFIFGTTRRFLPSRKKLDSREIYRYWANTIRPACDFGMDLQFYSLKDSGITNLMEDGISPLYVQGQADHSSLAITEKYAHRRTPAGYEGNAKMKKQNRLLHSARIITKNLKLKNRLN